MIEYLTNPFIFAGIFAIISILLCYSDKCIFKYNMNNNIYLVKISILVYLLVLASLYGFKYINLFSHKMESENLQTGGAEF